MNSEWSLDILYKGYDDPAFEADMQKADEMFALLNAFATDSSEIEHVTYIKSYIELAESYQEVIERLFLFANLKASVNTRDAKSASICGELSSKVSETAKARAIIHKRIATMENLDEIIKSDELLSEYAFILKNLRENHRYMLSDDCEELLAKLRISGGSAWSDLQSFLTSSVTAEYRSERIGLSSVRNLAYDPDPDVRKDAYEAELACYEKIKDSVAFSLNSIKRQMLTEVKLRGYASPLDKTLCDSHMKRETLDALLGAMEEYMHIFRRYLRLKAAALGHKNGMPWYDMFAPMGTSDKKYTTEDAREYLVNTFARFDKELSDMVARAFDEAWIDFYPRDGKVGGAFCAGIKCLSQSRVLTNFDGSFSDVVTLAHELGHAFHNHCINSHRPLNDDYSMPVAETASIFNQHVVMDVAISQATQPEEKLQLIESQLMDVTQVICDIMSRYLFESAVFEKRENDFMFADALSEMMLDAQKKAYADGLDPEYLHKYMWVCKGHYYSDMLSFYNFPYAFGDLFARGLYAEYLRRGEEFIPVYKKLLYSTPIMSVEDAALVAGIDVTKKDFWVEGLKSYERIVNEFAKLVNELYGVTE